MPNPKTIEKAKEDAREGKSPSTQAGEFVREEIHHIREGKHGARSTKQAIAIGLSEARRAGIKLPPKKGKRQRTDKKRTQSRPSARRSHAILSALKNEPASAASHRALSRQARENAKKRGPRKRHAAALKAVHTKGHQGLKRAAEKAGRTREKAA